MTFNVFLLILVLMYIFVFGRDTMERFSAIKLPFDVSDATNKVKK